MAENIREEDVILMTFSTYKRSGKTNYVKKVEKCQNYFEKGSERRACFFLYSFLYLLFFARLLTIYCKEVIAAFDTNSDAADIFLALSHGMDEKLSAEESPYVQIPTQYLKFTACFFFKRMTCGVSIIISISTLLLSVPHRFSKSMYKYNEFQNYNILCKVSLTHIL